MAKKLENEKDIIVRMVNTFREWYYTRNGVPVQYGSQNAYVIEYNTMKGIFNMLRGTYQAKNPNTIPSDDAILGMWQRLLAYLTEKNNYYYMTLGSIHKSYNTIIAQLIRHNQKLASAETKKLGEKQQQKLNFLTQMMNG